MSDSPASRPSYLVFGASGGIGSALVRRLVAAGGAVCVAARPSIQLVTLAGTTGTHMLEVDATDHDAVGDCVKAAVERLGRLDGIASCVGSLLLKPAHRTSASEWRETIDTNLGSAFSVVAHGAAALRRGGGSIVLVSSAAAAMGMAKHEAIAAAKAGVEGLVRSAAATYGSSGLRFNAVAPGLVRTRLTDSIVFGDGAAEAARSLHALGRLGEPDDVAAAIEWLLDERSGWVTGQVLGVDGGLSRVRPPARISAPAGR